MLPNMASVLGTFEQTIIKREKTVSIVDFQEHITYTDENFRAVVQVADTETLNTDNLDFSKEYIAIHSTTALNINDTVQYKGNDYRIIQLKDYSDYGYFKAIAEEYK